MVPIPARRARSELPTTSARLPQTLSGEGRRCLWVLRGRAVEPGHCAETDAGFAVQFWALPKRAPPHALRHSFATHLLASRR